MRAFEKEVLRTGFDLRENGYQGIWGGRGNGNAAQ